MTAPDFYYPSLKAIASISLSNPAVITTFGNHNFQSDLVVRIVIPSAARSHPFVAAVIPLGMPQIDGKVGQITVLSPTSFSFPINSTGFTPYSAPLMPANDYLIGQAVPIATNPMSLTQNINPSTTINNNNIPPEVYPPPPYPPHP